MNKISNMQKKKSSHSHDEKHSWFTNPLDWPHIDRMILFAGLVLLSPTAFGVGLLVTLIAWPEWFNHSVAIGLLILYATGVIVLIGFIYAAFRLRDHQKEWPLMENIVIYYFLMITYVESWLSGLHFTAGLLLVSLCIILCATLGSLKLLYHSYYLTVVAVVVAAMAQLSGFFSYAPLFIRPIVNPDGSPVTMFLAGQIALAMTQMALLFIALEAVKRWKIRESVYFEMSSIDGLTKLLNRRSFVEIGEREFELIKSDITSNFSICLIMLDIDFFKSINDNHGHQAGDTVLVAVAEILKNSLRQNDIVGRYGGEEFVIILPSMTLIDGMQVAERLRHKIAMNKINFEDKCIDVTASFGVASYPNNAIKSFDDLLKEADEALYHSKNTGRNLVTTISKKV